jgi:hypothetical protein
MDEFYDIIFCHIKTMLKYRLNHFIKNEADSSYSGDFEILSFLTLYSLDINKFKAFIYEIVHYVSNNQITKTELNLCIKNIFEVMKPEENQNPDEKRKLHSLGNLILNHLFVFDAENEYTNQILEYVLSSISDLI